MWVGRGEAFGQKILEQPEISWPNASPLQSVSGNFWLHSDTPDTPERDRETYNP